MAHTLHPSLRTSSHAARHYGDQPVSGLTLRALGSRARWFQRLARHASGERRAVLECRAYLADNAFFARLPR
jgi:hypothetical protein